MVNDYQHIDESSSQSPKCSLKETHISIYTVEIFLCYCHSKPSYRLYVKQSVIVFKAKIYTLDDIQKMLKLEIGGAAQ